MEISFSEKDGLLLPFEGSRSLTAADPWEEAKSWCQQILISDRECNVVGLGAGFHIAELLNSTKVEKVNVIDCRPGLVNLFRRQFPECADKVQIIIVDSGKAILSHEVLKDSINSLSSTYPFIPSWAKHTQLFTDVLRHLTGRSPEALQIFLEIYGIPNQIQIIDDDGRKVLSIKDIEILIQESIPPYLRLNCFRILKELIL